MSKMTFQEKRARINELEKIIKDAEVEIRAILEPNSDEASKRRSPKLPGGFVLKEKVLEVVKEMHKTSKNNVIEEIAKRHGYRPTDDQVQGALSNLKAKGKLQIVGRGEYQAL